MICAHCGIALEKREEPELEHAQTPRGPMHWCCYWRLIRRAQELAVAVIPNAKHLL